MKKFILTLTIVIVIFGTPIVFESCSSNNRGSKAPESKRFELDSTSQYYDQNYRTYTLEGCEYVVVGYGNSRWGSHKGNCKNPIHKK